MTPTMAEKRREVHEIISLLFVYFRFLLCAFVDGGCRRAENKAKVNNGNFKLIDSLNYCGSPVKFPRKVCKLMVGYHISSSSFKRVRFVGNVGCPVWGHGPRFLILLLG